MVTIYDRAAATTTRLMDKFGQGEIKLIRYTEGEEPAEPWMPPSPPTRTELTLRGAAKGVGEKYIGSQAGGETIVASDREVIVAPFAGEYDPADVLEIDGDVTTVLSVQNIPAAGTVAAVRFICRG